MVEDALAGVAAGAAAGSGSSSAWRARRARGAARAGAARRRRRPRGADPRRAPHDWQIVERRFDARAALAAHESVFAVGNGYLGIRGTPEEGAPSHDAGVILNGLHETWPIVYPEDAYGLARMGQTIVNATDGSIIRLFVDDEPFDLATARLIRVRARARHADRRAEPRGGVGDRARPPRARIRSRRLASLEDRHLAAIDYEVVALDGPVRIAITSELVTHAPGADRGRPAPREGVRREGARAASAHARTARAPSCSSPLAAAGSRWRAGWSTTSTPRPR